MRGEGDECGVTGDTITLVCMLKRNSTVPSSIENTRFDENKPMPTRRLHQKRGLRHVATVSVTGVWGVARVCSVMQLVTVPWAYDRDLRRHSLSVWRLQQNT